MTALLREVRPNARRCGTVFTPAEVNSAYYFDVFKESGRKSGVEIVGVAATGSSDVSDAALALMSRNIDVVCQISDNLTAATFTPIAQAAQRARLPIFSLSSIQSKELAEVLREGVHEVRLDLSGVNYLSSAGIGTLVEAYKEFKTIQGSFTVVHPSPQVRTLLTMTKLDALLIAGASPAAPAPTAPLVRQLEHSGVVYEIFDLAPGESLSCAAVGNPSFLEGCHFRAEHCQAVRFPASSFAVGLGGFGDDFSDCRGRFGEFLSVAGAAA